jgi:hypothetical protein
MNTVYFEQFTPLLYFYFSSSFPLLQTAFDGFIMLSSFIYVCVCACVHMCVRVRHTLILLSPFLASLPFTAFLRLFHFHIHITTILGLGPTDEQEHIIAGFLSLAYLTSA